jgi:hypothetical protein
MTDPNGRPDDLRPAHPQPGDDRFAIRYTLVDVELREAAAAEEMREACAGALEPRRPLMISRQAAADKVLATPIPAPDALARALAQAERRGMERAAEIAKRVGRPAGASDGGTYVPGTSGDAAAAILAAAKEIKP